MAVLPIPHRDETGADEPNPGIAAPPGSLQDIPTDDEPGQVGDIPTVPDNPDNPNAGDTYKFDRGPFTKAAYNATPYHPSNDPAVNTPHAGQNLAVQMADAGAPSPAIDQWRAQTKQQMIDAGAPVDQVDHYWGDNVQPDVSHTTGLATATLKHYDWRSEAAQAKNPFESFLAGLQMGDLGLATHGLPTTVQGADPSLLDVAANALGQGISDLPVSAVGAMIGKVGGAALGSAIEPGAGTLLGAYAGGGFGATALPEAVRQSYLATMEANPGSIRNFGDWWNAVLPKVPGIVLAGATGSLAGGAALGAGAVAAKLGASPLLASATASMAAMTTAGTAGPLLQGRLPSVDDMVASFALGLGFGATHYTIGALGRAVPTVETQRGAANVRDNYGNTGLMPKVQSDLANYEPAARTDMAANRGADGHFITPELDHHRPDEVPPPDIPSRWPMPTKTAAGEPVVAPRTGASAWAQSMEYLSSHPEFQPKLPEPEEGKPANGPQDMAQHVFDKHWEPLGINNLPADMRMPVMDAALEHGNTLAKQWLDESNLNTERFNDLRRQHIASEDMTPSDAADQVARIDAMERAIGTTPIDQRFQGQLEVFGAKGVYDGLPEMGKPPPPPPPEGEVLGAAGEPGKPKVEGYQLKTNEMISDEFHEKFGATPQKGLLDYVNPKKILQNFWNYDPQRHMDKALGLTKSPNMNFEDLARQTTGAFGRALRMLTVGGVDPITYDSTNSHSLKNVMKLVDDNGGTMKDFETYWTAKDTLSLAERGIDTPFDKTDALQFTSDKENMKRYDAALKELQAVDANLLHYSQQTGLIRSTNPFTEQRPYHVDLSRIADPTLKPTNNGTAGFGVRQLYRKIKGSDQGIIRDPMTSFVNNAMQRTRMADINQMWRNVVARAQSVPEGMTLLGLTKKAPLVIEDGEILNAQILDENGKPIPEEAVRQPEVYQAFAYRKFAGMQKQPGDFLYFNEGRPEIWHSDLPDIAEIARANDLMPDGFLWKVARGFSQFVRAGITLNFGYALRVTAHAGVENAVFSDDGMMRAPYLDMLRGATSVYAPNAIFDDFVRNGGMSQFWARKAANSLIEEGHKTFQTVDIDQHVWNAFRSVIDAQYALGHFIDSSARVGRFAYLKDQGFPSAKAAMSSRKTNLDYDERMSNTLLNHIASTIPFMTTAFKDIDQVLASMQKNPGATLAKAGMYITGPTMMIRIANYMADKKLPPGQRYEDQEPWMRYRYYTLPPINGVRIRIPRPYVGGYFFSSLPEALMDHWMSHDPDSFETMAVGFMDRVMPQSAPPIIMPIAENVTNHSFVTGRKMIPGSMEQASGYMQYGPNTSRTAIELAKVLNGVHIAPPGIARGPDGSASAVGIDDYMQNWLGTMPYNVLSAISGKLDPGPWHPATGLSENPFTKSFFMRAPAMSSVAINDFYAESDKVIAAGMGIKKLTANGEAIPAHTAALHQMAGEVTQYRKAISNIFKTIDAINRAPLISEEEAARTARNMNDPKGPLTSNEKTKYIEGWASQAVAMAQSELTKLRAVK